MRASRTALLKSAIGTSALFLFLALGFPFPQDAFSSDPVPAFTDISATEQLYAPHILKMAESHLIRGVLAKDGTAAFQPGRSITRAELAKVTSFVRLAEQIDRSGSMERIRVPQEVEIALRSFYRCSQGVCGTIGGKAFSDVAEKADECSGARELTDPCAD